jgi:hypothetical protein
MISLALSLLVCAMQKTLAMESSPVLETIPDAALRFWRLRFDVRFSWQPLTAVRLLSETYMYHGLHVMEIILP